MEFKMDANTREPIYFMQAASQEALKALDEGEVPVGAVIEKKGSIIGRGYNRIDQRADATAHAGMRRRYCHRQPASPHGGSKSARCM